jgi:hypothetical protein
MFEPKDGQYYYRPFRGKFGIWQKNSKGIGDDFVCDTHSKQDAARIVKELNNW